MLQKISYKVLLGPGPIDDTRPIVLSEYMSPSLNDPQRIRAFPNSQSRFTTKIGGTTFEVSTHFSEDGIQSVLRQFKDLLLSRTESDNKTHI